jgi:Uri superfamily endonuclease
MLQDNKTHNVYYKQLDFDELPEFGCSDTEIDWTLMRYVNKDREMKNKKQPSRTFMIPIAYNLNES